MRQYLAILGAVLVLVAGVIWALSMRVAEAPIACNTDAKMCPDGSAVGRSGPDCEFAACPVSATTTATSTTSTLPIGGSATISSTTIRILSLVQDSRCPVDVECIQAGTVRIRVSVDFPRNDLTLTLGQPQLVGNMSVMLASATPEKHASVEVQPTDYRFTLRVEPKAIADASGVRGSVLLGPTCPVERIPPDPACAHKPYATAISVYRAGTQTPVMIGNSDAKGAFQFSLPAGNYTLKAKGGTTLPRCGSVTVAVVPGIYATTTISCDTGIR